MPMVLATPTASPMALGSLGGWVTDTQTGLRLPGATIQAQNLATGSALTVATAADGRYAFDNLPEGAYSLTFAAFGYATASASAVVAPGGSGSLDQALATSAGPCAPASGPRTIAPEIARPVQDPGELYYSSEFDCFWTSGSVTLSADPAGSLPFDVDDGLELEVQRPDGTLASWWFDFSNECTVVTDADPQDISTLFQPGVNHLWLRLYDRCGTDSGNSPLYLSGPSPVSDEPPSALDQALAVLPVGDQDLDTPLG
jgi:hypothetical protein